MISMTSALTVPHKVAVAALSDVLMEVRHETNVRFLDHRGDIAEDLKAAMKLPNITVSLAGIEIKSEDETEQAFVTLGSSAFLQQDGKGRLSFAERSAQLVRKLTNVPSVFKSRSDLPVTRVGIRGKFLFAFEGSFEELTRKTVEAFGPSSKPATEALGGKMVDVGYIFNVISEGRRLNISIGPMKDDQVVQYFNRNADHEAPPDVGLYIDVDVAKDSSADVDLGLVERAISDQTAIMVARVEAIRALVYGD